MTDTPDQSERRAPRWMIVVLLASLMINMLVVGLAAGRMWAHRGWHEHGRGGVGALLSKLPEARQQEIRGRLDQSREEARALRREVRRLRQIARDVMLREPFDRAALESAMAEVNAARVKLGDSASKGFVDLASQMTAEERKALAEFGIRRRGKDRSDEGM